MRSGLALVFIGVCAVALYCRDPSVAGNYPPCPFHLITGLYCPGCGSLRAVHQLLHGHFSTAIDLNPLILLGLSALAYLAASEISVTVRGRPLPVVAPPVAVTWGLLALVIVFTILRNVPVYPFTFLAP